MFLFWGARRSVRNYRLKASLLLFMLVSLLTAPLAAFAQTTYYVASSGNDANSGTSSGYPFQNLARVNQLSLQPGDVVLFRRGDTFRGTLTIRQSGTASRPILFDVYGNGDKPVLAGSVSLTNWSNLGGNVWQANCPSCGSSVTGVYSGNRALPLGRYPNLNSTNKGYLTMGSGTQQNRLVSQEYLPGNINWTGGEAVIRPSQWILDRALITQQSSNTLTLVNTSSYPPSNGWGYFIQNHPATLDQDGEWYYDVANKRIQVFSSQVDPNSQPITATTQSKVLEATSASYVKVRNLQITQSLNESVSITNVSNFTVASCDITNSGEDGLLVKGSGTDVVLEDNTLTEVNNNGVKIDTYQNVTFRGNRLHRIGVLPGRGKGGDGQYNGIQSTANVNVLIENNVIDSVGYNGLTFGNNTLIQYNVISNYCMTKSDGGAIYAWNGLKYSMSNITIQSNIIYNGIGAPEGSFRKEYAGANGIFLDDCVQNVTMKNNTIFNNVQWGVFLHAIQNVTFTGNTSINNGVSQFSIYPNGGECLIRNVTVKQNVFVSTTPTQLTAQYESTVNDFSQFGQIDYNCYARPFDEGATILSVIIGGQTSTLTVDGWRNYSGGQDAHSKSSPLTYKQYGNDGAGGTNRVKSSFDTDLDGWYLVYSNYNNATAVLDTANMLDGNSMRVSFPTPSGQSNSYAQAIKRIGTLTKGKTYVLRFDAVASTNVDILVYLRSYGPPYVEYDRRYTAKLSPTRTSFEFPYVASADGVDPIIMFQTDKEGPIFWIDNIRFQEDAPIRNQPEVYTPLFYNPTMKDSVITLSGAYRDANNQVYRNSVTLKPFSSIVLFKDTVPVSYADLALSMWSAKRVARLNEPLAVQLRVRNQSLTPAAMARWTYRLPANLDFITDDGQTYSDNVMTGTVYQLSPLTDTVFTVRVRPAATGFYRTAAQITTATSPDPDSRPNSGNKDGEDDAAMLDFRVDGTTMPIYESPNPNQRVLPSVASSQPTPNPNYADLSLRMAADRGVVAVNGTVTYTLYVTNAGGRSAGTVQLENQLPDGVELVQSSNWQVNGRSMKTTLSNIASGSTASASFQIRVKTAGLLTNQAQISTSNVPDSDSTPGNGFSNGEDDEARTDIRSQ